MQHDFILPDEKPVIKLLMTTRLPRNRSGRKSLFSACA